MCHDPSGFIQPQQTQYTDRLHDLPIHDGSLKSYEATINCSRIPLTQMLIFQKF